MSWTVSGPHQRTDSIIIGVGSVVVQIVTFVIGLMVLVFAAALLIGVLKLALWLFF